LYRIPLIDSRVNIYLYGIVIVVGIVDTVDKYDLIPPVGDLARFNPDLGLVSVPKNFHLWTDFG